MTLCPQNKTNIHTDIYLLRSTSFSNCTRNAQFKHHSFISRGSSNEYSLPQSSYCILRYSSVVHQPVSTHTSGVPAESVSHNTALAKAVRMALTCIHHKPPAWEGMSRGALPGCCVSTRRRASAGHGWMTWRSDHWGENERC